MKKIFLSMLLIAFMVPAMAANDGGGKKKARKKARTECRAVCDPGNCDPRNCDPRNCDPSNCDPKCVGMASASKEVKCSPTMQCSGNK